MDVPQQGEFKKFILRTPLCSRNAQFILKISLSSCRVLEIIGDLFFCMTVNLHFSIYFSILDFHGIDFYLILVCFLVLSLEEVFSLHGLAIAPVISAQTWYQNTTE